MTNQDKFNFSSHDELLDSLTIAKRPLKDLTAEIMEVYLSDNRPWVVGFSGGKDSTAILSLIYSALLRIVPKKRHKHIYIVTSDTLVETPVVVDLIGGVVDTINKQAVIDKIPMTAHTVFPKMNQTFWVNLLGRGYPAPRQSFRWCTERMKIDPVSEFITDKVAKHGEVIVALGSRSQESSSRAQVIAKHSITGSHLARHTSLPNAYTYMPIENWSADEVWEYLMGAPCPWGGDNWKLFELYKGSNQGECPLVIDTNTPSCGNSRFGCWTCTVVTEDKALHGLIESGDTWMQPLLDFRNQLFESTKPENKPTYRNYKRRTGKVSYMRGEIDDDQTEKDRKHIPGPYWLKYRKKWLKELLEIEQSINSQGHKIELLKPEELQAIRQEWIRDPNEPDWEDSLPSIYADVYDNKTIDWIDNDAGTFTAQDSELLRSLSNEHTIPAELIMKLLEVELAVSGLGNRRGILKKLDTVLNKDWDSLEDVKERLYENKKYDLWKDKLNELRNLHDEVSYL